MAIVAGPAEIGIGGIIQEIDAGAPRVLVRVLKCAGKVGAARVHDPRTQLLNFFAFHGNRMLRQENGGWHARNSRQTRPPRHDCRCCKRSLPRCGGVSGCLARAKSAPRGLNEPSEAPFRF